MENYNEEELILREPLAAYGKELFTIEEYLEYENASQEKHEFYKGEIFRMPFETNDHCRIAQNLLVELDSALKKSEYEPWVSNKRLHIPSISFFTYADLTIAPMGELPDYELGASLPTVIIEVLSKSTQDYDRGLKFELYKNIPSFKEYILVDSQKLAVDIYRRTNENKWELQQYTKKDRSIEIKSFGFKISFKKIYADVQFNDYIGIPPIHIDDLLDREPIIIDGKNVFSIEEYLQYENASPAKHEYYRGSIFAMAGASKDHCRIARNLLGCLMNALENSPCEPFGTDSRLHIPSNTLFTYPDVSVFCDDDYPESETGESLPKVLIEVLSPSTRKYDRGKKFELYKEIPTLQEYILVDSKKPVVDIYRKTVHNSWEMQQYTINDHLIKIKALDLNITFEKIYYRALKPNNPLTIEPYKGYIERA